MTLRHMTVINFTLIFLYHRIHINLLYSLILNILINTLFYFVFSSGILWLSRKHTCDLFHGIRKHEFSTLKEMCLELHTDRHAEAWSDEKLYQKQQLDLHLERLIL